MKAIRARKKTTIPLHPEGEGASANLEYQLPKIAETFPEIAGAHKGTINLQLEEPVLVLGTDHRTPPIQWRPDGGTTEIFDFVRVEIEVRKAKHSAWLYVAHDSPHRADRKSHEIIVNKRIEIDDGEECVLHILRHVASLPYSLPENIVL